MTKVTLGLRRVDYIETMKIGRFIVGSKDEN